MRSYLSAVTAIVLALGLAACDGASSVATAPDLGDGAATVSVRGGPNVTTTDVFQWCKLLDTNFLLVENNIPPAIPVPVPCLVDGSDRDADVGDAVMNRKANGFTWQLQAEGLPAGHAYTIWVGNFGGLEPPADPKIDTSSKSEFEDLAADLLPNLDFGHGAAGIVGGQGRITAAGNQCVHPLNFFEDGPDAGFVPGEAPDCDFVRLDEGIWLFLIDHGPFTGDQSQLRTPFVPGSGELYAFFPADE